MPPWPKRQADFKIVVQASILKLKWDQREATIDDVYDYDLLLIGEDDVVNKKAIITHSRGNHIFINVYGAPDVSTFHFPAILREGDLTISVSTGGTAPFMAVEMVRCLEDAVRGWIT